MSEEVKICNCVKKPTTRLLVRSLYKKCPNCKRPLVENQHSNITVRKRFGFTKITSSASNPITVPPSSLPPTLAVTSTTQTDSILALTTTSSLTLNLDHPISTHTLTNVVTDQFDISNPIHLSQAIRFEELQQTVTTSESTVNSLREIESLLDYAGAVSPTRQSETPALHDRYLQPIHSSSRAHFHTPLRDPFEPISTCSTSFWSVSDIGAFDDTSLDNSLDIEDSVQFPPFTSHYDTVCSPISSRNNIHSFPSHPNDSSPLFTHPFTPNQTEPTYTVSSNVTIFSPEELHNSLRRNRNIHLPYGNFPSMFGRQNFKLKTPKFGGKTGEFVKLFFSKFEKLCAHHNIGEDDQAELLPLTLEGVALEYYDNLMLRHENGLNYEQLKNLLIARFHDEKTRLLIRSKLNKKTLKPSETVQEYFAEMDKEASKIQLSDEDFIFCYIQGLPLAMKKYICLQSPTTINEVFNLSKKYEQINAYTEETDSKALVDLIKSEVKEAKSAAISTNSHQEKKELRDLHSLVSEMNNRLKLMESSQKENPPPLTNPYAVDGSPNTSQRSQTSTPWQQNFRNNYRSNYNDNVQRPNNYQNNFSQPPSYRRFQNTNYYQNQNFNRRNVQNSYQNSYQNSGQNNRNRSFQNQNFRQNPPPFRQNVSNNSGPTNLQRQSDRPSNNTNSRPIFTPHTRYANTNAASLQKVPISKPSKLGFLLTVSILNCRDIECLLDSGSQIGIINNSCLKKLKPPPTINPSSYDCVIAVNGAETNVLGCIKVPITLNNHIITVKLHILEKCGYSLILGKNFIQKNVACIDIINRELVLKTNSGELHRAKLFSAQTSANRNDLINAKSAFKVILLPSETKKIKIYPASNILTEKLKFKSELKTISATPQIVSGSVGCVTVEITNITQSRQTIFRNQKVGTFKIIKTPISCMVTPKSNKSPIDHKIPTELSDDETKQLKTLLDNFRDIFAVDDSEIGRAKSMEHHIRVSTNTPIRSRFYRTNPVDQLEINRQIDGWLKNGLIEPSTSEWSSPCLLVKKKDQSKRLVVDYRKINAVTLKDSYPLPNIQQILDGLQSAKLFTCLDLKNGFLQLSITPESRCYTAFCTQNALYQFKRTPFGLTTSPNSFMRLMEHVFRGLLNDILFLYLDDLVIHAKSFPEHLARLETVFLRLRNEGLTLNPFKCVGQIRHFMEN